MKPGSRTMRWTPEQDERLRSMMIAGSSPAAIGLTLQRSVAAIRARAHVLRLSFERPRRNTAVILKPNRT